jgi:hypothetical protein
MVRIDETQEAIARIRMAIDDNNKARAAALGILDNLDTEEHGPQDSDSHWSFGSPGPQLDSRQFEEHVNSRERGQEFRLFNARLQDFIARVFPQDAVRFEDDIQVRPI